MATVTAVATATTTQTQTLFPNTQQVMQAWQSHYGGLAIGTRRPTQYPEWVTLEVTTGGFATGAAMARIREGEVSSATFMEQGGIEALQRMLATGRYHIDQPENAALLVMVWLLQEGRQEEASALFAEIAPYLDKIRFYPRETSDVVEGSATVAAVGTIADLRNALQRILYNDSYEGQRQAQNRRQQAVAEGFAELQADAIDLLLTTVPNRDAFLSGNEGGLFALPIDEVARDAILARHTALVERMGHVQNHLAPRTTTQMMIEALSNPGNVQPNLVSARIRAVHRARGIKGSEKHAQYMSSTKKSAIPDQMITARVNVIYSRIASLSNEASLSSAAGVLAPVTEGENAEIFQHGHTEFPPSIVKAVRRTVEAPLEQLITDGVINSAEMIAIVMPKMLATAAGECIEDPVARRLYAQIAIAFSRRRSLVLVNLEKQVRLEELPWARPLLSLLKADDTKQCEAVVREAIRCYMTHFPSTITPNKLISAIKDVMRKGMASKANLMEELAADIFQNAFSPNFDAATAVASRMMRDTVYSRYYDLEAVYSPTSAQTNLFLKAKKKMEDWQRPHSGQMYDSVQGGRTIEAAMVITTHNLAQMVDLCDGMPNFDFAAAAQRAWTDLVKIFVVNVPQTWRARLHAQRDVAYIWRQVLFFISRVDGTEAQMAVANEMQKIGEKIANDSKLLQKLSAHFLKPLQLVISGNVHQIQGKVEEGAIVLGYYGWPSLK